MTFGLFKILRACIVLVYILGLVTRFLRHTTRLNVSTCLIHLHTAASYWGSLKLLCGFAIWHVCQVILIRGTTLMRHSPKNVHMLLLGLIQICGRMTHLLGQNLRFTELTFVTIVHLHHVRRIFLLEMLQILVSTRRRLTCWKLLANQNLLLLLCCLQFFLVGSDQVRVRV